jgi:hypothetical protein
MAPCGVRGSVCACVYACVCMSVVADVLVYPLGEETKGLMISADGWVRTGGAEKALGDQVATFGPAPPSQVETCGWL